MEFVFAPVENPTERYEKHQRYWKFWVIPALITIFCLMLTAYIGCLIYFIVMKCTVGIVWFSLFLGAVTPIFLFLDSTFYIQTFRLFYGMAHVEMCANLKSWDFEAYMTAASNGNLHFFRWFYLGSFLSFYFMIVDSLLCLSIYSKFLPGIILMSIIFGSSFYGLAESLIMDSNENVHNFELSIFTFQMAGLIQKADVTEIFEIYDIHIMLEEKKKLISALSDEVILIKDNESISTVTSEIKRDEQLILTQWRELHDRIVANLPHLQVTMENNIC